MEESERKRTTVYKIAVILSTGKGTRVCFYYGESVSQCELHGACLCLCDVSGMIENRVKREKESHRCD